MNAESPAPAPATPAPSTTFTAFRYRDFIIYVVMRSGSVLIQNMLAVVLGWQIYDVTGKPVDLGFIGLAQFLPTFLLTLPAGVVADRLDRRTILRCGFAVNCISNSILLWQAVSGPLQVWPVFGVLALSATARSFVNPALRATLPNIVPKEHFQNALAWDSTFWQASVLGGPALAGFLYDFGPSWVYIIVVALSAGSLVGSFFARSWPRPKSESMSVLSRLVAGLKYVYSQQILFAAISLDMFAVLLGGATALLPIYAHDILKVGPLGLGLLRGAPAVGAGLFAFVQARYPVKRRTGLVMLTCVAGFGVATILFGIATNFYWSLLMLALTGAFDIVSVNIRQVLVQFKTPDAMRGRVGSVNLLFTNTASSLGAFESGITAQWWGTVPSVVIGGIGTIAVVLLWAWKFNELRDVDNLIDEG